jgi:hypothetical protein
MVGLAISNSRSFACPPKTWGLVRMRDAVASGGALRTGLGGCSTRVDIEFGVQEASRRGRSRFVLAAQVETVSGQPADGRVLPC